MYVNGYKFNIKSCKTATYGWQNGIVEYIIVRTCINIHIWVERY